MRRILVVLCVLGAVARVQAQEPIRTSVLSTVPGDGVEERLAQAVGRVLRARADDTPDLEVTGTPGLGLADLQLALGCIGETDECLDAVASQLEVRALLLSSVDRAGDELVLTVTLHDSGATPRRRVAVRRVPDEDELLTSVEDALREALGLPPAAGQGGTGADSGGGGGPGPGGRVATSPPAVAASPPSAGGPSPVSYLVGGIGLAAVVAGVVFGVQARASEDDYASAPTDTVDQVDHALSLLDRAQRQALTANVLFGLGGGLVATSVVIFILTGRRHGRGDTDVEAAAWPGGGLVRVSGPIGRP